VDDNRRKALELRHLISPLCERLERWRREIGEKTHPHLEDGVKEALKRAQDAKVEEGLVIYVMARCEYWFRTCRHSKPDIERALSELLHNPRYTPYRGMMDMGSGISSAVRQHIDRCLAKGWDPEASDEMDTFIRWNILKQKEKLAGSMCCPFLVSEHLPLPPRKGKYADWAPWVAASVVYRVATRQSPTEQDPKPRKAAEAVISAMRGTYPDKSAFHRKRGEIIKRAPGLVKGLIEGYQKAKTLIVQDERILPLIDEDCFPSLMGQGGWSLLCP
jgi:hypothetical protein